MPPQPATQLKAELLSRWRLVPSDQWLDQFLSSSKNPSHPLAALASTAHFRLLSSDITATLSKQAALSFPSGIQDIAVKEAVLGNDIVVQVLDIVDTSTSKWSQIEAIERVERGEEIRGREIIRNVPEANDGDDQGTQGGRAQGGQGGRASALATTSGGSSSTKKGSTGPHKLLLQDANGTVVWAFEQTRLEQFTIINMNPTPPGTDAVAAGSRPEGTQIGCKLLLSKGTKARRGLLMLSPTNVSVMGGRVDVWDQKWREGRKTRLQAELDTQAAASN